MIKELKTPAGEKKILLGYSALKLLAQLQKEAKLNEFEMVEQLTLHGFNTWEKRNKEKLTTMDSLLNWLEEDEDLFFEIQAVVTEFSENFTKRGSASQSR